MGGMTHRQRVLAALNHHEPDRVPVDLGATRSTSIVVQAYERLNAHLGAQEEARIFSKWLNIAHPSQAMLARFDIDTQRALPFGSPEGVRAEVRRRIEDLAPGGGYVLAAVHNIQADVTPENICAMYDTAREFGRY